MAFGKKISSPGAKLAVVTAYIAVITMFDVYFYGIVYQQEIKSGAGTNPLCRWVFVESGREAGDEHITVPRYRVIQKSLEISGLLLALYFCGWLAASGLILSHYLLTYDLLFYLILNPGFIGELQRSGMEPYWLVNPYQIGYFILKPFNAVNFYISGFAGILIAVIFCVTGRRR
jgi:hypothetical protein